MMNNIAEFAIQSMKSCLNLKIQLLQMKLDEQKWPKMKRFLCDLAHLTVIGETF